MLCTKDDLFLVRSTARRVLFFARQKNLSTKPITFQAQTTRVAEKKQPHIKEREM
jgi:hypothetical protein